MSAALPWDDLKVCFGISDDSRLWKAHKTGRLTLPLGWSLCETDGSGARLVALFRVTVLPTVADAYKVKAELRRYAR